MLIIRNWIDYDGKEGCILIWGQDGKAKLLDIFSCLGKNKDTVRQGAPLTLATVFVLKLSSKVMGVTTG
jgi:hypothetical protein